MAIEIVAINPGRAGAKKQKESNPMTEKKNIVKKKGKKKKNPSVGKVARAAGSRAKSTIAGMNIKRALQTTPARVGGMLATKWAAKKFPGTEGGGDREDWTFSNYLAGGIGGFIGGAIAENFSKGTGQTFLEGSLALLAYKVFENEVVPKSEFLANQFGQDDEPVFLLGAGDEDVEEGDLLLGEDGEMYMMGADGYTRPLDERHRQLAAELAQRALAARPVNQRRGMMGGQLDQPGQLGGDLQRPGTLGGDLQRPGTLGGDPYVDAYAGRDGW